jgi:DNA-binding response OmpR family regulator
MGHVASIVLLDPEWPARALLRAQLIEEGYDVVATDAWPIPRQYLRTGTKPDLLIVDLHGLPEPRTVLDEAGHLFKRDRVLVLAGLGTITVNEIHESGFRVITRPASIGDIVVAVHRMLDSRPSRQVDRGTLH